MVIFGQASLFSRYGNTCIYPVSFYPYFKKKPARTIPSLYLIYCSNKSTEILKTRKAETFKITVTKIGDQLLQHDYSVKILKANHGVLCRSVKSFLFDSGDTCYDEAIIQPQKNGSFHSNYHQCDLYPAIFYEHSINEIQKQETEAAIWNSKMRQTKLRPLFTCLPGIKKTQAKARASRP